VVNLCYKAAALLTLAWNHDKYKIIDTEDLNERLKLTNEMLKSEIEIFKSNSSIEKKIPEWKPTTFSSMF